MAAHYSHQSVSARYQPRPYSASEMSGAGMAMMASMKQRIGRGLDVNEAPAPPLTDAYRKIKQRRTGSSIRDWRYTGVTLQQMQIMTAGVNTVTIGFAGQHANMVAAINNARCQQFALSRNDLAVGMAYLQRIPTYTLARAA